MKDENVVSCTFREVAGDCPPRSVQHTMLYMEQWEELARYISDEVLCGLGNRRTVSVSASGVTPFKKGLRELLITALARRGINIVDTGDFPVLEFDVLPVSQEQTSFYMGMRDKPVQIMVNTSILDRGRYLYRNSSIHAVPSGELFQYIEEEVPGTAPFKTYQLVSS